MIPRYVIESALEDGRLEQLLPKFTTDEFGLYAPYLSNRHLTSRVGALIDHPAEHWSQKGAATAAEGSPTDS